MENTKDNSENIEDQNEETIAQQNSDNQKKLSKEEELELQNKELNDKYLRLYSDFENFRKRTQKEKLELYKTAGEDVIKALLPILDDFERAFKAIDETKDIEGLKGGVKLIHNKLLNTLKQKGLEEASSSIGKEFNVELHEAITQIPAPKKKDKGKVLDEIKKGYHLNGKVIRYAKVVVGQ